MSKLLIVEDDQLISRLYEEIFSFEKHDVTLAGNGEEGLVAVKKDKPDLIMLDVMMPKMNGLEMLERLKVDPETKTIPVVMLTNLAGKKDAETALAKGAVKYIIKSDYDPKQISDMIKEVLEGYTRDKIPGS